MEKIQELHKYTIEPKTLNINPRWIGLEDNVWLQLGSVRIAVIYYDKTDDAIGEPPYYVTDLISLNSPNPKAFATKFVTLELAVKECLRLLEVFTDRLIYSA